MPVVVAGAALAVGLRALQLGYANRNTTPFLLKRKVPAAALLIDAVQAVFAAEPNGPAGVFIPSSSSEYDSVLAACIALRDTLEGVVGPSARVLYCEPDGTVVVDTAKGPSNTWSNFQLKMVNENHNTRVAISTAQEWPSGYGAEVKESTSTGTKQVYAAGRLGNQFENRGTLRWSYDA